MFDRSARCTIALALCLSVCGHWYCLQSIAWATMIANYSQSCSFSRALVKTFDGNHPCDLCKHIAKAKETEKKQDKHTSTDKTDLFCVTGQNFSLPAFVSFDYPGFTHVSMSSWRQPPTPPPRRLGV